MAGTLVRQKGSC